MLDLLVLLDDEDSELLDEVLPAGSIFGKMQRFKFEFTASVKAMIYATTAPDKFTTENF